MSNLPNPVDPKIVAATLTAGVGGAIVMLIMNLIYGEPLNQEAMEIVITAIITAALTYGAAWLKKSGLGVLVQRTIANGGQASPSGEPFPPREGGHANGYVVLIATAVSIIVFLVLWFLLTKI